MPAQLPMDCLNEIFEFLEEDKITLCSCLLVNHLWCEVSVRILWRNVQNHRTLVACLPDESKEILYKNKIIISTPTPKHPLFHYVKFIKILSIHTIDGIIKNILKDYQSITPQSLNYKKWIIAQEMYKLLMNQISSLRALYFYSFSKLNIPNITFASYPGSKVCLKNLSDLSCRSDLYPEFFYQLSQFCHNIQYLNITFKKVISNGITDLISVQQNLKYLDIMQSYDCDDLTNIIPSLTKLPNTLIKLDLYELNIPLSFIAKFTNLQELILSFDFNNFEGFNELQYVSFPQLQILKFEYACPRIELLIKFLENNGKYLKELYVEVLNEPLNSLNLAIAKLCPNLKKFFTIILDYESKILEEIFNNCQYLESIKVWCGDNYLNEKELLEIIAKYSPKNFHELRLYYNYDAPSELLPIELESFFISWIGRVPQKSLSLIITNCNSRNILHSLDNNDENLKIIEKYVKLGIIKKFIYE